MKNLLYLLCFAFLAPVFAQQSDFRLVSFEKADAIAQRYEGETLHNLPALVIRLTAQLDTDVEKFRAIYYWISHNIRGDYDLMSTNERYFRKYRNDPEALQAWMVAHKKKVFDMLLNDKVTLCTGYAYLVQTMAQFAGIEAEIIHGYSNVRLKKNGFNQAPNHSWNAVKLNGKWYLCDATWSSGVMNTSNYKFEAAFEDSYFLMDPVLFAEDHIPVDEKWKLLPEKTQ
ncbi:MAG: transglutaminase domain-containing protein [Marinirhabdus sp.]|nr:transglutaminase domain-containing protein [Marinirhabdus sp.]